MYHVVPIALLVNYSLPLLSLPGVLTDTVTGTILILLEVGYVLPRGHDILTPIAHHAFVLVPRGNTIMSRSICYRHLSTHGVKVTVTYALLEVVKYECL